MEEVNKQPNAGILSAICPQDKEVMEQANEILKAGISSTTCSRDKDISSDDQSFQGWMGIMRAEDMEVLNDEKNRDFHGTVSSGNVKEAESMLKQNPGLAKIKIQNGMLPIHIAASGGHRKMWQCLLGHTRLDDLEWGQIVQLFFTTLKNSIYDGANSILLQYPRLSESRDEQQLTAFHVLARKLPEDSFRSRLLEEILIDQLYVSARLKERNKMLEFISKPSGVLFDAAKSGKIFILKTFLESYPELLMVLDSKRRSLLHTAVLHRQVSPFFDMIKDYGIWKDFAMQVVDDDGNNILQMAGMTSPRETFESPRSDILMQRELLCFKEVETMVPTAFKSMRNKEGQTPKDIFYKTHRKLIVSPRLAMKDKANYGMLVATIIATIVFAASLTVPGHDVSPEASSLILQKQRWFIVFFVSNSLALFSSSASIIFFLSILTSSYTEDELSISLQLRLMFGVGALFVAITTMVVAFTAACFLIFSQHCTWVLYLVASLGSLTVALFVFLLRTLFRDLMAFLYSSKAYWRQPQQHKSYMTVFIDLMEDLPLLILYHLFRMYRNAKAYLLKMCQNGKSKLLLQKNNPMTEP